MPSSEAIPMSRNRAGTSASRRWGTLQVEGLDKRGTEDGADVAKVGVVGVDVGKLKQDE